jgi:hypothetical protein
MECAMFPADGIFGIASMGRHHLMKRGDSIALLEFGDILTNLVHNTSNIITLI